MEEADQLCRRVAIMDKGKLLALDSPARLKAGVPGGYLVELEVRAEDAALASLGPELSALGGVVKVEARDGAVRIYSDHAEGLLADAMRLASARGVMVTHARVAEPSLENLFLHLTGRSLRD